MKNRSTRMPVEVIIRIDRLTAVMSNGAPKPMEFADTVRALLDTGLRIMEPANGITPPPEAA